MTEDMVAENIPCGPDLDAHVEHLRQFADAGIDELYVQQTAATAKGSSMPISATSCRS